MGPRADSPASPVLEAAVLASGETSAEAAALASADPSAGAAAAEGTAPEAAAAEGTRPGPAAASAGRWAEARRDVVRGLKTGLATFWQLARFMVPAYFLALVLERVGAIEALAGAASPVMSLLGLPGEAALPLVIGYILNIYAAVGAMQALSLSASQVTVLAIAILIGHNLLVEGAVLQRAGSNGFAFGVLRAVAGLAAAALANLLMGAF
ncbi:MAG TPA: hypothetical protein PLB30_01965 [Thermoleophilia bacterium]|nr:hypothetical protein [Thermoleophilia bacterium]HQG54195.1 hypothetical protein [Thermoleophilia bacterium]HQJ97306.1 hypothetical protein [Thermoleophilia bacterium]